MTNDTRQSENHFIDRVGWLRASVLGANDCIVSTASMITGVASAGVAHSEILLAGTAGLVAGAMSMAAVIASPVNSVSMATVIVSLLALAILGGLSARTGGAPVLRAVLRVTFWGAVAMAAMALVGSLFGTTVA